VQPVVLREGRSIVVVRPESIGPRDRDPGMTIESIHRIGITAMVLLLVLAAAAAQTTSRPLYVDGFQRVAATFHRISEGKLPVNICPPLCYERPIFSTSLLMASWSSVLSGKDRNNPILRLSTRKASQNARAITSDVPFTAAGSVIPQCAVRGRPGQQGHTSLAALSHTVPVTTRPNRVGSAGGRRPQRCRHLPIAVNRDAAARRDGYSTLRLPNWQSRSRALIVGLR
jgi:hypothetical protein